MRNASVSDITSPTFAATTGLSLQLERLSVTGHIPPAVRNLTQINLLHLELAGNDLAGAFSDVQSLLACVLPRKGILAIFSTLAN